MRKEQEAQRKKGERAPASSPKRPNVSGIGEWTLKCHAVCLRFDPLATPRQLTRAAAHYECSVISRTAGRLSREELVLPRAGYSFQSALRRDSQMTWMAELIGHLCVFLILPSEKCEYYGERGCVCVHSHAPTPHPHTRDHIQVSVTFLIKKELPRHSLWHLILTKTVYWICF